MKKRNPLRLIGHLLLDCIEIYIPTAVFFLLFVVLILQIFFRYFLTPLTWPIEFTLMAFIWTTLFGACFAMRDSSHVRFTLIYDRLGPKARLFFRLIGNGLLVISFCAALYPSYVYVNFMSFKVSNVLKIPMNVVFFPFVIFLIIMTGRLIYSMIADIRRLRRKDV